MQPKSKNARTKLGERSEVSRRAARIQHRVAMMTFSIPVAVVIAVFLRTATPEAMALEIPVEAEVEEAQSAASPTIVAPRGLSSHLGRTLRAGIGASTISIESPREYRDFARFLDDRGEGENWVFRRDRSDTSGSTFEIVHPGPDRPIVRLEHRDGDWHVVSFQLLRARSDAVASGDRSDF